MGNLWQDVRYAARMLRKTPGLTIVAALSLALGIGANTAIFSVVNTVLLRPLPYPEADRLLVIREQETNGGEERSWVPYQHFLALKEQSQVFEDIAAFHTPGVNLTIGDSTHRIYNARATANLFSMLGVKPVLGRTFLPEEGQPGSPNIVVLDYEFWQERFGGDRQIINRSITIDEQPYTVIGVVPSDFHYRVSLYVPLRFNAQELTAHDRNNLVQVVARRKSGISNEQTQAALNLISPRLRQLLPDTFGERNLKLVSLHEQTVGDMRPALLIFQAAVGLVLLIACANVANLLLARGASRRKEMALRLALGARRGRLIRQLLTESALLALLGGAAGLLLAMWGMSLLAAMSPGHISPVDREGINPAVLIFTVALSLLTGIAFGLVPALQSSKLNLTDALKEGSRDSSASFKRNKLRSLLVVVEVAISLVLLISAGLLIKSFIRLQGINPGFDAERVLKLRIALPESQYATAEQKLAYYQQALARIEALPGVESAGWVNWLPFGGGSFDVSFSLEERQSDSPKERPEADCRVISPDYLRAMSIPLRQGRYFTERDTQGAPSVVIISETLARRFFAANENPLGKRLVIEYGGERATGEIIGVVGDVKTSSLTSDLRPAIYGSYLQSPWSKVPLREIVVRSSVPDPASLAASVQKEMWAINKDVPIYQVSSLDQVLNNSLAEQRFNTLLLTLFACAALILSAIGIYGVMAYTTSQRTRELGIRMALGAQKSDVLKLVLGQGMTLALLGVALGLLGAFAVTRVMESLLYGVSATDPLTYVGVALLLAGVALVACLVPARKATKVDPMVALRYE